MITSSAAVRGASVPNERHPLALLSHTQHMSISLFPIDPVNVDRRGMDT